MRVAERERKIDSVEELLHRGYKPAAIARNIGVTKATVARYVKLVEERLARRQADDKREARRARLINSLEEAQRRAWESFAAATNAQNTNGAVGALRTVVCVIEALARIQGLDGPIVRGEIEVGSIKSVLDTLKAAIDSDRRVASVVAGAQAASRIIAHADFERRLKSLEDGRRQSEEAA